MTTQTSRTYMWNTRDRLGHGATGQVFAGYHRETGAQVAVKVLNRQSELRAIQNEIEAVRRIPRHDNIVQFLAYEDEKATQFPVIVMELCNSGSLYEVVDSPENAFGVEETQFKQVISDVAEGLHHLKRHSFAHRDIKPGNIMRCQLPDGSYVFKLADFGTARQLAPEQMFTSIYGTEEYLHPSMYERALINPRMKAAFKDKVDLWSVGATFFHVATGRLPYSPYAKRNDRTKMFDIISNKPEGAVMGWQIEPDGPTQYSKQLPDDILLSDGLKGLVTPVMANLMENEFSKMWGFNKFFDEINRIVKMKVVDVFCISLCRCCKVYIDPNMPNGVQNLKELISIQTQLDSRHMELFYDNLPYHNKGERAAHLPNTTAERPIVVFGGPPQKAENLQVPVLPTIPQRLPQISVVEDLRYAKECNRAVCAYLHFAEKMQQMFSLMHQSSHTLLEVINHEFSNLQDLSFRVEGISTAVNRVLLEQIAQLHSEVTMISAVNNPPNERLAFPLQKMESDRLFKQDQLNQRPMRTVSLRKTLKDFEPQLIQLREFWDPKLNCDVFDKSGARAMGFYVKAIQSLFQQLQQERNRIKSGIPTSAFDQKVHDSIKVQLENRLREAHYKLQQLVKARSEVYTKLYHFLGTCIALREDIGGFYESLQGYEREYNTQLEELETWRKEHQQLIQGMQHDLSALTAKPPATTDPYLPQIISLLEHLKLSSEEVATIASSQSNIVKSLPVELQNGTNHSVN